MVLLLPTKHTRVAFHPRIYQIDFDIDITEPVAEKTYASHQRIIEEVKADIKAETGIDVEFDDGSGIEIQFDQED